MKTLNIKTFILFICGLITTTQLYGQVPSSAQNYIMETVVRSYGNKTTTSLSGLLVESANRNVQYFDGLGRPMQTVQWQGSPARKDIVRPISYDEFGREVIKYLPYAEQSSNDATFKSSALTNQNSYYNSSGSWDIDIVKTPYPYSKTVFESSPLDRVLEQGAPGIIWQPASSRTINSGRTMVTDYQTNTSTDVLLWSVSGGGANASAGYYPANRLYKTVIKDENWTSINGKGGTTEEYKDLEGRIVLKKVWETDVNGLSTYYVYDDFGNLTYVIPPAVNVTSFTESDPIFTQFIYGYEYDNRNRVIRKHIPGKGWEHFAYDSLDRVTFTQDEVQYSNALWTFYKYDAMGRVIMTGIYQDNTPLYAFQSFLDGLWIDLSESRDPISPSGYTNRSYPLWSVTDTLTINYYDDYDFPGGDIYNYSSASSMTKGLQTGSKVRVLGTSDMLLSLTFYDDKARVAKTFNQHYLSGDVNNDNYDEVNNSYNFAGELTASTRVHHSTSGNTSIANRYEYDHMGRKKHVFSNIDGAGEIMLSELKYNEIGQVREKDLHSTDNGVTFMQGIDYSYNERGWMTKINDPLNVAANRVFGMELLYGNKSDAFNGNIGGMSWQTMVPSGLGLTQQLQSNVYDYDKLNRLVKSGYTTSGAVDKFNEELTYDLMGNITSLKRKNTVSGYLNDFSYNYTSGGVSGNKLMGVTDAGTAGQTSNYTYNDLTGNLETDSYKGLAFQYNLLNLPSTIVKSGIGSISYLYDASGNKLKKTVGSDTRHYIDGIEYKNGAIDFILTEEGRAVPGTSYSYEYMLKDHLGNVRATVNENQDIIQVQDYYAFGMEMATGNTLSPGRANEYKYNGKEIQKELGLDQYDYGARFYDPVIGRFNIIDPKAELGRRWSPYNYAFNNPIRFVDPDGMWPEPWWLYALYKVAEHKVKTGFGLVTAIEGAQDKARNVAQQRDPGYVANVPENTRNVIDKGNDLKANNKMAQGMTEVADATLGTAGVLLGGIEGTLGPVATKTAVSTAVNEVENVAVKTLNPYDLTPTHGITNSKKSFSLLKADIQQNGVKEAIDYVEHNGTKFIVNGHHRVRAAKELGIKSIPVKEVSLPYSGYRNLNDLIYSRY